MSRTYGHLNEHDCQILATNHKNPCEAITKEKLAFEVAKLVKCCIQDIKVRTTFVFILSFLKPILVDEPGCADITFENLVFVRLVRVSRTSWQPVLWCEEPASRAGPS